AFQRSIAGLSFPANAWNRTGQLRVDHFKRVCLAGLRNLKIATEWPTLSTSRPDAKKVQSIQTSTYADLYSPYLTAYRRGPAFDCNSKELRTKSGSRAGV